MSKIKIATSNDQERWNKFIIAQENAGPFHLFEWKLATEEVYQNKSYYLISEDDDANIIGVLPLILVKPPFLNGTLVSLPYCDYGGILSQRRDTIDELAQYAIDLASSLNAKLELRYKEPDAYLQKDYTLGVMTHKSRMILDLHSNSESLWNSFKTKLRTKIRKPQKEGFEFKMGSAELIDDFYHVFSINMRALGSPIHSKNWIKSVISAFGDLSHIGVVYDKSIPIASGIIIEFLDSVTNPWASALDEYNSLRPNLLLYWNFLKYACDNGFKRFDFGRSTPGEGTYIFKEQWGAKPYPLYWYGNGTNQDHILSGQSNDLRKMIEKTWAKLPQRLVDSLGPRLRKYIIL